jgi:uncharacterized ion transporter superfamily protein YfcC
LEQKLQEKIKAEKEELAATVQREREERQKRIQALREQEGKKERERLVNEVMLVVFPSFIYNVIRAWCRISTELPFPTF